VLSKAFIAVKLMVCDSSVWALFDVVTYTIYCILYEFFTELLLDTDRASRVLYIYLVQAVTLWFIRQIQ
jgi:hypothetical protein